MIGMVNDFLWGYILVFVIVFGSIFCTLRFRFIQFRYFGRMVRVLGDFFGRHSNGRPTSFQTLLLSLGGHVGSGNIAGVAVAISLGGAGAIFWMWLIGLLNMSMSFFECMLAQLYKRVDSDGQFRGGPAIYIEKGVGSRFVAGIYAALLVITLGFAFASVQSNVISASLSGAFGISVSISSFLTVFIGGIIIFGGLRRIIRAIDIVVPIMSLGYIGVALFVVLTHLGDLPTVFLHIFRSAFGFEEFVGGGLGVIIMHGVRRGLFSNEAGLGSVPNAAATADVLHPVTQGITQAFSVFIDTLVICSCTAMIILLSDVAIVPGVDGIALAQDALVSHVGFWGVQFVSIALVLFAFSSIIYNYYVGENGIVFFNSHSRFLLLAYRGVFLALVGWGSFQTLSSVLIFADLTMGLLALINLICLGFLFKIGKRLIVDYESQLSSGVLDPVLNSASFSDLDIDHDAWSSSLDSVKKPSDYAVTKEALSTT